MVGHSERMDSVPCGVGGDCRLDHRVHDYTYWIRKTMGNGVGARSHSTADWSVPGRQEGLSLLKGSLVWRLSNHGSGGHEAGLTSRCSKGGPDTGLSKEAVDVQMSRNWSGRSVWRQRLPDACA